MPSRERVADLITYATTGKVIEAIYEFYAPDATMKENQMALITGIPEILTHEQEFLAIIAEIHEYKASSFAIEGDKSYINWVMEFTDTQGRRIRIDEVAHQTWQGDKIISEQFYYDTAPFRG